MLSHGTFSKVTSMNVELIFCRCCLSVIAYLPLSLLLVMRLSVLCGKSPSTYAGIPTLGKSGMSHYFLSQHE